MEDEQILKWNNHGSHLLQVFRVLRRSDQHADVSLFSGGKEFLAHKVVLSACSDYFATMLNLVRPEQAPIIFLDLDPQHMFSLLDYMYMGQVQIKASDVSGFLEAAQKLKIKGLWIDPNTVTATATTQEEQFQKNVQLGIVHSNYLSAQFAPKPHQASTNTFHKRTGDRVNSRSPPPKRKRMPFVGVSATAHLTASAEPIAKEVPTAVKQPSDAMRSPLPNGGAVAGQASDDNMDEQNTGYSASENNDNAMNTSEVNPLPLVKIEMEENVNEEESLNGNSDTLNGQDQHGHEMKLENDGDALQDPLTVDGPDGSAANDTLACSDASTAASVVVEEEELGLGATLPPPTPTCSSTTTTTHTVQSHSTSICTPTTALPAAAQHVGIPAGIAVTTPSEVQHMCAIGDVSSSETASNTVTTAVTSTNASTHPSSTCDTSFTSVTTSTTAITSSLVSSTKAHNAMLDTSASDTPVTPPAHNPSRPNSPPGAASPSASNTFTIDQPRDAADACAGVASPATDQRGDSLGRLEETKHKPEYLTKSPSPLFPSFSEAKISSSGNGVSTTSCQISAPEFLKSVRSASAHHELSLEDNANECVTLVPTSLAESELAIAKTDCVGTSSSSITSQGESIFAGPKSVSVNVTEPPSSAPACDRALNPESDRASRILAALSNVTISAVSYDSSKADAQSDLKMQSLDGFSSISFTSSTKAIIEKSEGVNMVARDDPCKSNTCSESLTSNFVPNKATNASHVSSSYASISKDDLGNTNSSSFASKLKNSSSISLSLVSSADEGSANQQAPLSITTSKGQSAVLSLMSPPADPSEDRRAAKSPLTVNSGTKEKQSDCDMDFEEFILRECTNFERKSDSPGAQASQESDTITFHDEGLSLLGLNSSVTISRSTAEASRKSRDSDSSVPSSISSVQDKMIMSGESDAHDGNDVEPMGDDSDDDIIEEYSNLNRKSDLPVELQNLDFNNPSLQDAPSFKDGTSWFDDNSYESTNYGSSSSVLALKNFSGKQMSMSGIGFQSLPRSQYMRPSPGQRTSSQFRTLAPIVIGPSTSSNINDIYNDMLKYSISIPCDSSTQPGTSSGYSQQPKSVKSFMCPLCKKTFEWASLLNTHLRIHTGEKPYGCPKCPYRSTQKGNVQRHIHTKHVLRLGRRLTLPGDPNLRMPPVPPSSGGAPDGAPNTRT